VSFVVPELLAAAAALVHTTGGFGRMSRRIAGALRRFRIRRGGLGVMNGDRHGGPFHTN
jgi:hypothetical protein